MLTSTTPSRNQRLTKILLTLVATVANHSVTGFLVPFSSSPRRHVALSRCESSARFAHMIDDEKDKDGTTSRSETSLSRRDILISSSAASLAAIVSFDPKEAVAFPNKISNKYDDRPKRRGPQPKDLGVLTRKNMQGDEYQGLKPCGAAPNCFCSTDDVEEDPEHFIPAWTWPTKFGDDKTKAFLELEQVVNAYQPGQSNIDGGGFKIIKSDPDAGYLYTQFESLKAGYIDDFELAYVKGREERAVQVRSSSRVGYLDFGVNAKRINFIAKAMREKGWDAPGVDFKTHPDYAYQNNVS